MSDPTLTTPTTLKIRESSSRERSIPLIAGNYDKAPYTVFEILDRELREDRIRKAQWMRAWIAYSEMHRDKQLRLRTNLSRDVPSSLEPQHKLLLDAYSKFLSKLSSSRNAITTNMGRNLVRRIASPRITTAALGAYARFDTTKLVRTCPFFRDPLPTLIEAPYDWYGQPKNTQSLWSYEKMSIYLKEGKIVKPSDWYSGDEPYALSVTTYYRAPEENPDEIAFEDFDTSHKTHDANPSTGLGAGDEFSLSNSELVKDLYLRDGIAAWSTAISFFEADAPDRQALQEALDSAEEVLENIATVAGAATNIPANVPYIKAIAVAVQKATQIASEFTDLLQTFLTIFEDSDDFLGSWGVSESTTYLFPACPPERTDRRTGTVSGTGAMYRATLEVALTGCVPVHDQTGIIYDINRTEFGQVEKGKNAQGMPDLAGYNGWRPIIHFFPETTEHEEIESASAWVSDIEAGSALIQGYPSAPPDPDVPLPFVVQAHTMRVQEGQTVTLELPNPGSPNGKMPIPFVAPSNGLVAGIVVHEWYTAFPFGPGYVRYKWNMKATGKGEIIQ